MQTVSPVIPGMNFTEIIIAKDQQQYNPLPAIKLDGGVLLTRWHLSDEERKTVAETGDIYVFLMTGGEPVLPIDLVVEKPELEVQPAIIASLRKTPERVAQAAEIDIEIFTSNCDFCGHDVIASTATKGSMGSGVPVKLICLECFKEFTKNTEVQTQLLSTEGDFAKVTDHLSKK